MAELTNSIHDKPERPKSGIFQFIHKRTKSDGTALTLPADIVAPRDQNITTKDHTLQSNMPFRSSPKKPAKVLGEWTSNRQDAVPTSPSKAHSLESPTKPNLDTPRSPIKNGFFSVKSLTTRDGLKINKDKSDKRDASPKKANKTKSSTNLAGLLSRPKSSKDLKKLAKAGAGAGADQELDKENSRPKEDGEDPFTTAQTPIWAQFCSQSDILADADAFTETSSRDRPMSHIQSSSGEVCLESSRPMVKSRPKSFQPPPSSKPLNTSNATELDGRGRTRERENKQKSSRTWLGGRSASRPKLAGANTDNSIVASTLSTPQVREKEPQMHEEEIPKHLESLLDRRNIPENQRYKMRSLANSIKLELIKQDWAEQAAESSGTSTTEGSVSTKASHDTAVTDGDAEEDAPAKKRGRGKSFTSTWKMSRSPSKPRKKDGNLFTSHLRNKSTDSIASARPLSRDGAQSPTKMSFLAKVTGPQTAGDHVAYLRRVQRPQDVEVGKMHKLRLLLRNERVAWAEDFIQQGGMKEIVDLLYRILEVEWREEHEDQLLHENLLCLKALCTTDLALRYLHDIRATLMPAVIHMLFDPEKKGPSEYTTRGIVTSVLLTYIQSASMTDRDERAQTVLSYLRDSQDQDKQPVEFVLGMRRDRPYKEWHKENSNVTKEVFWIFLHPLNIVAIPKDNETTSATSTYMDRHFPRERPPVAAAPYVGGVEWDATNYLASHLDLMNAIIACTPETSARNAFREQLRMSGFERYLGGYLRTCSEKFYTCVHESLRTWVGAATEDGWDVRDVRYGPPAEPKSPRKKSPSKKQQDVEVASPKLEMPKFDIALDSPLDMLANSGGGGAFLDKSPVLAP